MKDTNVDSYTPLRIGDVPELDIEFIESVEAPGRPRRAWHDRGRARHRQCHLCGDWDSVAPPPDPASRRAPGARVTENRTLTRSAARIKQILKERVLTTTVRDAYDCRLLFVS